MAFQFAYLELHSQFSPFGGLSSVEDMAEQLGNLTETEVAAALTDTFSLAAYPWWQRRLSGGPITALAGAEVAVNALGLRGLPYALVLLAENSEGYANLGRLVSSGLIEAGKHYLTAGVSLETLQRYRQGLVALAPYWGGPVMAALQSNKYQEARGRAQALLDIFGPGNFYLAAPTLAGQPLPQTVEARSDDRLARANAALVKLSRELKIGLIATGEARYSQLEEARPYTQLRHRLQRALSGQYPLATLQNPAAGQDWLYSLQATRPTTDLHLRSTRELLAHYNEQDWPGALANNRQVAARCAGWYHPPDYLIQLRETVETALAGRYNSEQAIRVRPRLENELARVADLDLAAPLVAAARVRQQAAQNGLVVVPRRLNGSLLAYLLDLTEQSPSLSDLASFEFEAYTEGRALRLEVGRDGRERLLVCLNGERTEPAEQTALGLAVAGETGELPTLHPRQLLVSLDTQPLSRRAVLQPAQTEPGWEIAVISGPLLPEGTARLEISQSNGVGQLQLVLDLLNRWRQTTNQPLLRANEIPLPNLETAASERDLLAGRLAWLRQQYPAAFLAAALDLAPYERRQGWAEQVRKAGLRLLPPDVMFSQVEFGLEGQGDPAVRAGLGQLLGENSARQLVAARQEAPFTGLDELLKRVSLSAEQIERLSWAGALDHFGERERLAAGAPQLAATSAAWQAWQKQLVARAATPTEVAPLPAQPTLFDLFDSVSEPAPSFNGNGLEEPAPVTLAEAAPLSRLERLRRAFQTLGFFTVEHPLWDQAPAHPEAPGDLPVPLAELSAQTGEGAVLIFGLITALRRLPIPPASAGSPGEELTVLQVEDFSGQAQLLVPQDAPAPEVQFEEGAALAARVNRLKNRQDNLLVAVALATYPTLPGAPAEPDLPELPPEPEPGRVAPPPIYGEEPPLPTEADAPPPSLFGFGIAEMAAKAANPPANSATATGNKGKGSKTPVPRIHRRVIIRLPRTGDPESDLELMNQVKQVLRKYSGDDRLVIYIPLADGSLQGLEPQGLEVTYSEEFAAEMTRLVGAGGVKVEETPF